MSKRYLGFIFSLALVLLLFYCGLNMAEKGTTSLVGGEAEKPRAVRISLLEDGKIEVVWAGNNRVIDVSGAGKRVIALKENAVLILKNIFDGGEEEAEEE